MKRVGFKMKLHEGKREEYKKRHDEIWPELVTLLKDTGISDYVIFLDDETNDLIGFLKVNNEDALTHLPDHPVMQKWWAYMKDIMDTHSDNAPVQKTLDEVFYMA